MNVTQHPSTRQMFIEAQRRWRALKREHDNFCRAAWLGYIVSSFTDEELALLAEHYLTGLDRMMLRQAGREILAKRKP